MPSPLIPLLQKQGQVNNKQASQKRHYKIQTALFGSITPKEHAQKSSKETAPLASKTNFAYFYFNFKEKKTKNFFRKRGKVRKKENPQGTTLPFSLSALVVLSSLASLVISWLVKMSTPVAFDTLTKSTG